MDKWEYFQNIDNKVDEITKDSEKNVINDFSKNLDGVFDELKQIRENPKVKNTPKYILKMKVLPILASRGDQY